MSKMANKSLIGAFVVGAIALAVISVIIFGSGKFLSKLQTYVLYFQGSVKGLSVGSPVLYRGVKIGEVKDIAVQFDAEKIDFNLPVIIDVDVDRFRPTGARKTKPYEFYQTMIDKGLRAQLQSQSFVTGQLAVALDFYPDKPAKLHGLDKRYRELPTVPTPIEELQKTIQDLNLKEFAEKVKETLNGIDKAVNSPEIAKTLKSVSGAAEETRVMVKNVSSQVTPLVSNLNETVKDARKMVENLDRQMATVLPSIEGTMKDAQKLVQHVDTRIDPMAANAEEAMKGINSLVNKDVKNLVGNLDQGVAKVVPELAKSLETLRGTLQEAQGALRSVGGSAGAQSPLMYQLTKTLEELANAAQSLRSMADYLEQHPESLIRGK
jgi:paraquat-inducible protein B